MKKISAIATLLFLLVLSGTAYADFVYQFEGTIAADDFFVGSDYSDVTIGDTITIWTIWNNDLNTLLGFGFQTGSISYSSNSNLTTQGFPPGYVDHYSDNSVWLKLGTEVGNLSFNEGEFFAQNPKLGPYVGADDYNIVSLDVSQVPIPGAVWLFACGLIGIAGLKRRFKKS